MSNSTIDKLISMIFKTIKDSIYDISIVGETLTRVNALKLDATNISGYATALKGLSTQQAQLVMTTNGLTTAQQQAVLSQISLANATGTLTTSQMTSALITETRNEADAKALLLNAGLISSETAEATATNTVTAAKLRELVATGQLTQAEAQLLATKAGVTLANQKEASSFALLGDKFKSFGNSLLAIGKAHPILAVISIAIGAITTAVTIAEKKNEEFIESQEKLIEKIDENISKYDEEISSLDSLQDKLQNAKGDKEALASIQSELNQAIGDTPGLLNEESNAYDIANQKIDDRIERLKGLRKLELEDKVTAQKEIFDNTLVDNNWGIDHKFDYFSNHKIIASDTLGSEFDDYLEGINVNKFETLQSIFETLKKNGYGNGEKSNAEIWKELIDSYGGAMLDVEEIQNYFDSQTEYAQKILSDYVNNSESIFSKEELNSIIEDLVESGYSQDLEGIENVITSLVENDELEKTINDYYESLYNDDIDSDALYQNIKGQFDTLVANYPELKGILENYFNSIGKDIKTGINNASQNPDEITVPSWATKFQNLWDSEEFSDTKKSLQNLAKEAGITEDDIQSLGKENTELANLLEKSGMSAQFAATCFEKMCNGTGDFSSITNSTLALDQALHETETALENVTSAKTKYDEAMSEDDYNTEFKNYQEAYASAMESFKNGEYGKKFRASMEYLLGEDSYSMSIEELYKSMKKLKSVFGEDANNGLEFLDKLYEKKDVLKELDSTLEKTADGGYKFDIKVEDFDNIGKSLGMTTEEVTACVEALGMFGDYADFDIDKVKDALDGMAISVDKTGSSTVSLQTLENALADLGYEGYEAYQILEQLRSQDDVKLLNFDVSNSEQVHSLINKLKELDAIHIDPSGAIDTSSLVQKMADFGMTSDQISTFIKQINELTTYHFDGNNFEDLKSIQTYVDGVLGNTDQSSTESMETLKDAEDGAKTSAENLQDAIEGVNTTSVSSVTDGVSDLSDELNTANNKAITLKANLDKLNTNNLNTSNSNTSSSSSGGKLTKKDKTKTEATGTLAYAKGSKVTLDKDEEALVNELGEESVVRNGELHIIPGGAHIEKLKKGDIIFNHKQTEELKKNGRVTTNNGRGKVIGAFPSGTVSGKNPATKKNWSSSKDDKDKDKKNKSSSTDTTKFSQAIDWCAQSINKITSVIDKINAKLSSTNASLASQIKNYKQLINKQQSLINGYKKSESVYKKQYSKALSKLSKSDQKKVKNGTYTIEQFSGKDKSGKTSKAEKRYNNIQSALEARDTYLDSQTDLVNAKNQLQEYAEDLASVRWDKATEQVEKLNNQISVLDTRMSNVSGYKAKNKVLQEQLTLQKQILTKQENAYKNTESDANSYYKKISSKYKKNKNKDGTIKTKGVTNQTQLKYIKEYNAYVKELAKDEIELAQAQEDYTAAVQEATITRAENIKADYDNKLALIDAKANELDNQIALAEAKGQVASVEYYKQLGQNSDQRMTQLKSEKTQLEKQLATLRPYSDEWYEVKQAVIEVDEEIANETVNAVENINKQIEAMDELTNKKNEYITHVSDSLSWFEGLVDEEDMYDDDGNFTDKGLAVLQSKLGRIEASRVRQENALKRIQELDKQYEQGLITEAQYLTARNEWEQQYQDEISTTADIQDELNDITKKGLEMQSDALSELIEKKKKMIDLDQSEYDYQKSIAEKTKNITDLQKQLAMLEGDNSEEGKAQRQKLEVELKDAQEDLADTQYEKYVERLEDALDDLQDRFDALIEKLDNLSGEEAEKQAYETVEGNEANIEKGKEEVLSDAGAGTEFLNKDTDSLFSGSADDIGKKLDIANDYAEKTFNATVEGNDGTADLDVTLEEALGKVDLNNQKKYLAGDAKNKSALNKYLMSQGYSAMDEKGMLNLTSAILQSGYTSGMDNSLYEQLSSITSVDQLTKGKDPNYSDNKNAILEGFKYVQANKFISENATKAKYSRDKYGALNKKIYDITGGKVLNDANAIKLASMFNVKDNDKNNAINGDEAKKLVKLLEDAGFSNGGIVEAAVRKNGDDGIGSLQVGEDVLTPVQTTAFTKLAENIVPFNNLIGDIVERPNIPTVQSGVGGTSTMIDNVNLEFTLPNVTDKESFMKMFRNESDVRRMIYNSFDSQINSRNKNKKFGANRL